MGTTKNDIAELFGKAYKNVTVSNQHNPTYDYAFKVVDHIGNESAEIFYSTTFNEWAVILDNFPSRRKHYSWQLPVKDLETLVYLIEMTGIKLLTTGG